MNRAGGSIVEPSIHDWKLKGLEDALFVEAEEVPNWKLADKSRRILVDLGFYFSGRLPSMGGVPQQKIEPQVYRQAAIIGASGIAVRSVGSGMMMISSGYLPEAGGPVRRLIEAKLNAQAILDDLTGEYAIRYLQGRPGRIAKLAQKYGAAEDVKLLSMLAHANVRGLSLLRIEPPGPLGGGVRESTFSVLPDRDERQAQQFLYAMACECSSMCTVLAEVFETAFEMPVWAGRELLRIDDQQKRQREVEKAAQRQGSCRPASHRSRDASSEGSMARPAFIQKPRVG